MPTYGLVVEGPYDEVAITEFVEKLCPGSSVLARPCGGVPALMKNFPGHLESFRYPGHRSPVHKAFVIRDVKDPAQVNEILEKMDGKIANRRPYAYTQEVAREIAKESDLSVIQYRCPRFKIFCDAVCDC